MGDEAPDGVEDGGRLGLGQAAAVGIGHDGPGVVGRHPPDAGGIGERGEGIALRPVDPGAAEVEPHPLEVDRMQAAAGAGPGLEDRDAVAGIRQRPGTAEPGEARTDHDDVERPALRPGRGKGGCRGGGEQAEQGAAAGARQRGHAVVLPGDFRGA